MKIYISLISIMISVLGYSQVLTNQNASSGAPTSLSFIDASSSTTYNGVDNAGKGILFPQTDLTQINSVLDDGSLGSASYNPNYYDGLVVYNTGTGTAQLGQAVQVEPGYYYFSNPGATSVSTGQWLPIGGNSGKFTDGDDPADAVFQGGNVGIGTTAPESSAALQVESTTQGFLPPRMTTAQRDAIATPAEGLTIFNTTNGCMEFFNSTNWISTCDGNITSGACAGEPGSFNFNGLEYRPVESSGRCWLDRNLGATQIATSTTDAASYGDLYQWGRATDGHQIRTSATTTTVSSTDSPSHGDFIITNTGNLDWRSPQNNSLWQGTGGINNPCPTGYRLPTEIELNAERVSWSSNNAAGAFASPLKLPAAGRRSRSHGFIIDVASHGNYWSSTVSATDARYLLFSSSNADMSTNSRANGHSVRCLKD